MELCIVDDCVMTRWDLQEVFTKDHRYCACLLADVFVENRRLRTLDVRRKYRKLLVAISR